MFYILRLAIFILILTNQAYAGTIRLQDDGIDQGYPWSLNCIGGIDCSVSNSLGTVTLNPASAPTVATGWTDDGANVRLTTSGDNVGIGYTGVNSKLNVNGNVGIGTNSNFGTLSVRSATANANFIADFSNSTTSGLYVYHAGTGGGGTYSVPNNTLVLAADYSSGGSYAPISLVTSGSPRLFIESAGNIGIGSIAPTQALDVVGRINATAGIQPVLNSTIAGPGLTYASGNSGVNAHTFNGSGSIMAQFNFSTHPYLALQSVPGGASALDVYLWGIGAKKLTLGSSTDGDYTGTFIAGNIGLGTIDPVATLETIGTLKVKGGGVAYSGGWANFISSNLQSMFGLRSTSTVGTDFGIVNGSTGGKDWVIHSTGSASGIGVGKLAFWNSNDDVAPISLVIQSNGNVGIGTFGPTNKLDVSGSINIGNNASIGAVGGTSGRLRFYGGLGPIIDGLGGQVVIDTDGADILSQKNSTTAQEFRIYNTDSTDDEFASLGFKNNTNVFTIETEETGAGTVRPIALMGGNVGIADTTPSAKLDVTGNIRSSAAILANAYNSNDNGISILVFDGASNHFYSGDGLAVINIPADDNVGIGSVTPGTKLDVAGTIRSTTGGFTFPDGTNQTTAASSGVWIDGTDVIYPSTLTDNVGIGTLTVNAELHVASAATNILFRVDDSFGDTSPFVVTSDGNVGIGSAAPGSALDVSARLRLSTGSASIPSIGFIADTGGVGNGFYWQTEDIWHLVAGGTNSISLDNGGNVGIFDTTPTKTLDITGQTRIQTAGTCAAPTLIFGSGINNTGFNYRATDVLDLCNGAVSTMTLTQANNVGVGTTLPVAFINIASAATQDLFRVDDTVGSDTSPFIIRSDGNVGVGTHTPAALLEVKGSGVTNFTTNVGIGTQNPGKALDIVGEIRASSGTAGQAACWKADKTLGQCTSIVGAGGDCTCS